MQNNVIIKLQATKLFSLSRFNELKNVVRVCNKQDGQLYIGDTFECNYDLAKYLLDNLVVKVIEVIPDKK